MKDISDEKEYVKSNLLIGSKYRSSLLENKILAIALANIDRVQMQKDGSLISCIPLSEVTHLLGNTNGSCYDQLKAVAREMTGRTVGFENDQEKRFKYIVVIQETAYGEGKLTIEFNRKMKEYITDIKKNFTILSLETMVKFKSVYSFRLYELLKSMAYKKKKDAPSRNTYRIEFGMSELRLDLGIVNSGLDSVKRVLNERFPDYDRAVEVSPEKVYGTWYDFRRYVIEVAIKEINQKTDMEVSYETIKEGKAHKVSRIIFSLIIGGAGEWEMDFPDASARLTEAEKDQFHDKVMNLISEKVSIPDIRSISEAAEYDLEKVKRAYEVACSTKVNDMTAFMIAAIKKGYKRRNGNYGSFDSYMRTEYDFEELEKEILAN